VSVGPGVDRDSIGGQLSQRFGIVVEQGYARKLRLDVVSLINATAAQPGNFEAIIGGIGAGVRQTHVANAHNKHSHLLHCPSTHVCLT
jgi:hypothetical protein